MQLSSFSSVSRVSINQSIDRPRLSSNKCLHNKTSFLNFWMGLNVNLKLYYWKPTLSVERWELEIWKGGNCLLKFLRCLYNTNILYCHGLNILKTLFKCTLKKSYNLSNFKLPSIKSSSWIPLVNTEHLYMFTVGDGPFPNQIIVLLTLGISSLSPRPNCLAPERKVSSYI